MYIYIFEHNYKNITIGFGIKVLKQKYFIHKSVNMNFNTYNTNKKIIDDQIPFQFH